MQIIIDTDKNMILKIEGKRKQEYPLFSKPGFELISNIWSKVGWNQKYTYTFSWLGRPIIQLPEDMIRVQEVIYQIKPDVIIETGIAHGGSLVFYASLCKAIGRGRIIGVDIEIRPHNRKAIEAHELFPLITLIEGNSVEKTTIHQIKSLIKKNESVLVILDSNHTKSHVLQELEAYSPLVTKDSYLIVTDGIMQEVFDTPRGKLEWQSDNPIAAAQDFIKKHPEFIIEQPKWTFNESELTESITHWPSSWLKKKI